MQLTEGFHAMNPDISNMDYGYGLIRVDGGYYGHGGQTFGFESYITVNPDNNNTYIVGTNDAMVRSLNLFMKAAGISFQHKNRK
jgi:hypothetical protein